MHSRGLIYVVGHTFVLWQNETFYFNCNAISKLGTYFVYIYCFYTRAFLFLLFTMVVVSLSHNSIGPKNKCLFLPSSYSSFQGRSAPIV